MQNLLSDVRYALRMLRKTPGFTAVALLTLALGIGANSAIFTVIDAVLLRRLPFAEPERLVLVWEKNLQRSGRNNVVSIANFDDWNAQNRSFDSMAAFVSTQANVTGGGEPERVTVQVVSAGFFQTVGANAMAGRPLTPEDDAAGAQEAVVLSYDFWQRRYGGDPDIVGRTVSVDSRPQTVVGIMPREFHLSVKENSNATGNADVWIPLRLWDIENKRGRFLSVIARLKPGVSVEEAQADMTAVAANLEAQYPKNNKGMSTNVVPVRDQLVGNVRPALLVLFGAVGLVLLIACANVANLLLLRAATRRREIAIRSALGAGRLRVVRQLLTESLSLAVVGGLLGLLLAVWGTDLLLALAPADLLDVTDVRLDMRVLVFTAAVSVVTGVIFGLAPALQASRVDLNGTLKEGGRHATADGAAARLSRIFVVSEIALALVLLIGAGLLLRSFSGLQAIAPGFDPEGVVTAKLDLPSERYAEDEQIIAFYSGLLERVRAMPGVRSASVTSWLPLTGLGSRTDFHIEGRPEPPPGEEPGTDIVCVDPDYFKTMGIPLVEGRTFTPHEAATASHVIIVNETLAKEFFPGESAIGKRIKVDMSPDSTFCDVVGVVGDVRVRSLEDPVKTMAYWPHPELAFSAMSLVVKSDGDPEALFPLLRAAVRERDPELPVGSLRAMEGWMSDSLARSRFSTTLLGAFATVAFLLSVIGIYGVLSYAVALRTNEIGIRMALGAQRADVMRMVLFDGLKLSAAGLAVGLFAAAALNRYIASLLYGVTGTDVATYAAAALLFLAVSALACTLPARRAVSVDPMIALR